MASIRGFLKQNGNKSFLDFPFCEADLIVIALLSYCNYEQSSITKNKDLYNSFTNIRDFMDENTKKRITNNFFKPNEFLSFLEMFNKSSRYDNVELGFFEENRSNRNEIQFFGLTFFIDDKIFVTFRGTDRSVVGWQEDFDLVLKDVIPSQEEAKNYLFKMVNLLKKPVYVLGHSKGGNLAYFAYYFNDINVQDMVIKVYNLDGPGFKFDTKKLYKKNKEKLVKIVPHDDVVGILLNDPSELIICKSSEVNVNAHDLLTWQFDFFNKYKTLTRTKELTIYSETLRITINEFIKEIGIDNVKDVKTAIFEIVKINKVKDVIYIYEAALKNIHNGLTEMRRENPEQVKQMEQLIKQFLKLYVKNFRKLEEKRRSSVFKKFSELKEELK
ncbi:MAG: Mbeg1-like protein [Candidatus Onthovivens sp.]|nr:Mbeg1-like protein [Candidatus Onthovivens sp.]MDY5892256.1 Mbeg1-like protein [Candidatus Onthovivens sp.]MDY5983914.1 Mbeg1-like protein [Candidatus Onthovivens sp.]